MRQSRLQRLFKNREFDFNLAFLRRNGEEISAISLRDLYPLKIKASQKSLKNLGENAVLKLDKNGEVLEILGFLDQPEIDEKIVLAKYQRSANYPQEAERQAQNVAKNFAKKLKSFEKLETEFSHQIAALQDSIKIDSIKKTQQKSRKNPVQSADSNKKDLNKSKTLNAQKAALKRLYKAKRKKLSESFGREDLCDLAFCAIDPEDARDHDDAIFWDRKKQKLFVAIADVSEFVKANSKLDLEAKKRGFSVYLPHKAIPMLPSVLSSNFCSLRENEIRAALVWEISFEPNSLKISHTRLFSAFVKIAKTLNYSQVEQILQDSINSDSIGLDSIKVAQNAAQSPLKPKKSKIPAKIQKMLISLYEKTAQIRAERLLGGFDFINLERKLILDKKGELKAQKANIYGLSNELVEECMLLANIASADLLLGKNHASNSIKQDSIKNSKKTKQNATLSIESKSPKAPNYGIFRIHEEPQKQNLDELFSLMRSLGLYKERKNPRANELHNALQKMQKLAKQAQISDFCDYLIIRSFYAAKYSAQNLGHFGLGFARYCHFTSPIRRYCDLILHRILKAHFLPALSAKDIESKFQNKVKKAAQKPIISQKELVLLCEDLSAKEREVARIEQDFCERKLARAAQKNIGAKVLAQVRYMPFPFFAAIQSYLFDLYDENLALNACSHELCELLHGAKLSVKKFQRLPNFAGILAEIKSVDLASARIFVEVLDELQSPLLAEFESKEKQKLQELQEQKAKIQAQKMLQKIRAQEKRARKKAAKKAKKAKRRAQKQQAQAARDKSLE